MLVLTLSRALVSALTVAVTATALRAAEPARPVRVEHAVLRSGPPAAVELAVSRDVTLVQRRLDGPPRVYVDLRDATLAPGVARTLAGAGAVRAVRVAQFDPTTVRVVVELAARTTATTALVGTTLRITVGGPKEAPAARAASPVERPAVARTETPATPGPESRIVPVSAAPVPASQVPAAPSAPRTRVTRTALEDRIARHYANEEWPAVVAVYAGDVNAVRRETDAATRAMVADALRRLGLRYSAQKILGPAASGDAPAVRLVRAELALDDGDEAAARPWIAGLTEGAIDPALGPRLADLRVRQALARQDLSAATETLGARVAPELRAVLATAALDAGRRASARGACAPALDAYQRALAVDGGRTARAAAAAGLVQAALACQDRAATDAGLGILVESQHPLLRRAASVIATAQVDGTTRVAAATGAPVRGRTERGAGDVEHP